MDIDTAFLNGDLEEEVYMEQPLGFKRDANKVCLLKRSLYGLKQAPRAWNQKLDETLKKLGFNKTLSESCIYTKLFDDELVILAVYVDDIILLHLNDMTFDTVKYELSKYFSLKDLGNINYFLGLNVDYDRSKKEIKLHQRTFIEKVLDKFGMRDCKTQKTPMAKTKLLPDESGVRPPYPYQSLIGCLMFIAVSSRPDISFATSYLSQFNTKYNKTHWIAAKRVLQYLKGTLNYCITYRKSGEYLSGYADADWANCPIDRRSYTGFWMKLAGSPISWECKKQPTPALSSTEAEYMSLCSVTKEAVFLRRLLEEVTGLINSVVIYNDSQAAQKLAANPIHHNRTKHIDVKFHFIREMLSQKVIRLEYLPSCDMSADVITKALGPTAHYKCLQNLGLC